MNSEPGYGLPWRLGASLPADLIAPAATLSGTGEPIAEGDLNATAAAGTLAAAGTVRVDGSMNAEFPAASLQIVVPKYYPSRQPATPGAGLPWLLGFVSGGDLIAPAAILSGEGEVVAYLHVEVSDSVSVSDQTLVEKVFPSDAVNVTDTILAGLDRSVVVDDTCILTDLTEAGVSFSVTQGDSVSVTDDLIVTGALTYSVFINDTVGLTDQASHAGSFSVSLDDTLSLTDQTTSAWSYGVAVDDNLNLTDSVLVEGAFILNLAVNDTVTLTDEVLRGAEYEVSLNESPIGVVDTISKGFISDRILSDAFGIEDSSLLIETALFSDAVSLSDGVTREVAFTRDVSEELGVEDSRGLEVSFERLAKDEINIDDVAIRALAYGRSVNDVAAVEDVSSRDVSYRRFIEDTVLTEDETLVSLDMLVILEMPLDLDDAVVRSTDSHRITGDTLGFEDSCVCGVTYQKTVTDVYALSDSLHVDLEKSRKAEDEVTVTEEARTEETYARFSNDFFSVADWTVGEILKFKVPPGLGQRRVFDLQTLGRDGLYLRFDSKIVPALIFYTLYLMDRGAPVPIGGRHRPAVGPYGEYYVTNTNGEIRQPGKWIVRWEVWETLTSSSAKIAEQFFEVLPTPVPAILTSQAVKYGWS
jgi:hypothetical protein